MKLSHMLFLTLSILASPQIIAVPAQIIIVRHGEKPPGDEANLTTKGRERAQALAVFFKEDPFVLDFGLPTAIYAFKALSDRAPETMTPLALQLGIPIDADFTSQVPEMIAELILNDSTYDGKMVLLCWDHSRLPLLISALKGPMIHKPPSERYDLIYKLTYTDPSNPTLCIGLQNLMKDDDTKIPDEYLPYACPMSGMQIVEQSRCQ